MATDRHAEVTWNGGLLDGSGRIDNVGSGAFSPRHHVGLAGGEPAAPAQRS